MGYIQRHAGSALLIILATLLIYAVYIPTLSFAQEDTLSATIRASLLTDPRSQNLSSEELDALVASLVIEAQKAGITAEDIMWRPEEPEPEVFQEAIDTCGKLPKFLCLLNESLGFSSGNLAIPILLFFSSAALLFVLGLMIKMHQQHVPQSVV